MIQLTEMFNMVGTDGCSDVATSLVMQGVEPEISIPIYDIFFLKLMPGQKSTFLAESIPEFNAIRQLSLHCGAVAASINLLDMDILTLAGLVAICTPNTGMNIFMKLGEILTGELEKEIIEQLSNLAGMPIPPVAGGAFKVAGSIVEHLFSMMVSSVQESAEENGVAIHDWEELAPYYNDLRESGEMAMMSEYRAAFGGAVL